MTTFSIPSTFLPLLSSSFCLLCLFTKTLCKSSTLHVLTYMNLHSWTLMGRNTHCCWLGLLSVQVYESLDGQFHIFPSLPKTPKPSYSILPLSWRPLPSSLSKCKQWEERIHKLPRICICAFILCHLACTLDRQSLPLSKTSHSSWSLPFPS